MTSSASCELGQVEAVEEELENKTFCRLSFFENLWVGVSH